MKRFPTHPENCNETSPLNKGKEDTQINNLENENHKKISFRITFHCRKKKQSKSYI